jgi:hypothetical protein
MTLLTKYAMGEYPMKRVVVNKTISNTTNNLSEEFTVSCIPVIVQPRDLNDIYNYFLKSRPSKCIPIKTKNMVLIYEGEGGHA